MALQKQNALLFSKILFVGAKTTKILLVYSREDYLAKVDKINSETPVIPALNLVQHKLRRESTQSTPGFPPARE